MQRIFRLVLIVLEHGTTVSGYSWCQIYTYPTHNDLRMFVFPFIYYFLKYYWEEHLAYETYAYSFAL